MLLKTLRSSRVPLLFVVALTLVLSFYAVTPAYAYSYVCSTVNRFTSGSGSGFGCDGALWPRPGSTRRTRRTRPASTGSATSSSLLDLQRQLGLAQRHLQVLQLRGTAPAPSEPPPMS